MAKIKSVVVQLSGTVGDQTHVNSIKYDPHTRNRQRPGLRKDEPSIKENYSRTELLNHLAAGVNNALGLESDHHKGANFYVELQKRFRAQSNDNRFVLLSSLKEMDLHSQYLYYKLGGQEEVTIKPVENEFNVTVKVKHHPFQFEKTNCYCYKVILLTWDETSQEPKHEGQYSSWRYFDKPTPEFEFSFQRQPDMVHWLLCVKKQLGFNSEPILMKLEGAQIMEVGTFNEEDKVLLNTVIAQQELKNYHPNQKVDTIVRVKARDEE